MLFSFKEINNRRDGRLTFDPSPHLAWRRVIVLYSYHCFTTVGCRKVGFSRLRLEPLSCVDEIGHHFPSMC